jgi:predicted DNA-binding transcriptional regulator AlpA
MVGVSYPTIWRWVRDGKFPAPRTIGATNSKDGAVRWVQSELKRHSRVRVKGGPSAWREY